MPDGMKGDDPSVLLFQDYSVLTANANYPFLSTNTNHQLLSSKVFQTLHTSIDDTD